jgi:hypothetical protein
MTVKRVWVAFLLGAAVAACSKDTAGVLQTPPPLAGLRYFNVVPDTGVMDFRVVDVVAYAPNSVRALFRTGGNPQGITTTFPPPYLSVQAGTRHIKVFLDSTDLATASTVMLDTVVTFDAGSNYTFYLYGYSRTGQTPHINALITKDDVPTIPAGNIAVRTINLDPNQAAGADARVVTQDTALLAGAVTVPATTFLGVSNYVNVPVGTFHAAFTAGGTTTPILYMENMPAGVVGTSTVEPIAGTLVAGTAITMLVMPPSVAGSKAPQTPTARSITSITLSGSTATALKSGGHGLASNDVIRISGATQPEYNGVFSIKKLTDSTFSFQVYGGPASPATGSPAFVAIASDYGHPMVAYLIDQQPALTAP